MSGAALEGAVEILLAEARGRGATAADAVAMRGDALSVSVRLGEVEKVQRSRSRAAGLRVFVGKRVAVVSSADLDRDALRELAEQAVALARVTAEDPWAGLPGSGDVTREVPDLGLFDPALADLEAEQAIAWCREAESAAREADPRIRNSDGARFTAGWSEVACGATNGFRGGYRVSSCSLSAVPVAAEGGQMQRDYWYTAGRGLADLEPAAAVGREAARRALRRLGARKVGTCRVPVVFEAEAASGLLRHVAGAVCGGAIYRGMSFLGGKRGEIVASPAVSIADDGRVERGLGSKPFDAEGLATRRTPVIERGRLCEYLLDTYSARRLGLRSTGNAARAVGDAPHAAPTNFLLQPGTATPEEILRDTGRGFLVTETMGFGVNAVTGDYSQGAAGLWIENGEPAYPVQEVTIAGNLLEMLRAIDAVGCDLDRRRAVSAPTLRIDGMTVAGR